MTKPRRGREKSPPPSSRPKVYGYARVSTYRQTGGQSIDTQREQLRLLAERHGLGPIDQIFVDEEASGGTPIVQRPQGRELCFVVSPEDVVLLTDLDRAFRSTSDALETLLRWHAVGIRVIIQSLEGFGTLDFSTPIGEFFLTVLVAMKKLERNQRISFVMQCSRDAAEKAAAEGWDGSNRRFSCVGYKWAFLGNDKGKTVFEPIPFDFESMAVIGRLRELGYAYDRVRDEILPEIGRGQRTRSSRRQIGNPRAGYRRYELRTFKGKWQYKSIELAREWGEKNRDEQEQLIFRVASNHPEWANRWGLGNYVQGLETETNGHDGNGLQGEPTIPVTADRKGEGASSIPRASDSGGCGEALREGEALARVEVVPDGAQAVCRGDYSSDEPARPQGSLHRLFGRGSDGGEGGV